jgi:hypothetical protein
MARVTSSRAKKAEKNVDPELKEGIAEVVKAIDALLASEFPATVAALMFKMKEELIGAGFTPEEAIQLVIAHGTQSPAK